MSGQEKAIGVAVQCDPYGTIVQVMRDELGGAVSLRPDRAFLSIVDGASVEKARQFLAVLQTHSVAFDWELNVLVNRRITSLHFAGHVTGAGVFIAGAPTRSGMIAVYEEMTHSSPEWQNGLGGASNEQVRQIQERTDRDNALYEELSRLNNELVTLQRELAKKNITLAQLNERKNQFLGIVAHDLRNPLGVILGYSEFLLDEDASVLPAEHVKFMKKIQSSSEFMLRLVNDFLDLSQIESGKLALDLQQTDLISLIEHNVSLNRVLAEKKQIMLVFTPEEPLPAVRLDASKIEQVLNNLITNAVKFSFPHSTVEIRAASQNATAVISVKDNGQGIPAAELDHLFRPFQNTSVKSTSGEKSTGLGLMICRKIIEMHKGRIWVESEPGNGSVFYFSLPFPLYSQK